jgi:hypothetical protein
METRQIKQIKLINNFQLLCNNQILKRILILIITIKITKHFKINKFNKLKINNNNK